MGETYYRLDGEVRRVVSWFPDATVTTERSAEGVLQTTLTDTAGLVRARMRYQPLRRLLELDRAANDRVVRLDAPARRVATDWASLQLLQIWRDHRALDVAPEAARPRDYTKSGRFWRVRQQVEREQAQRVPPPDPARDVLAVRTEFHDLVAVATLERHEAPERPKTAYATFTSRVVNVDGQELGFVRWFAQPRVVTWAFASGERGVAPEWRIPGGFGFTPTLAWANVQGAWFARVQPRKARPGARAPRATPAGGRDGTPSERREVRAPGRPGLGARVFATVRGFMTRVRFGPTGNRLDRGVVSLANTQETPPEPQGPTCDGLSDGCTGLHWLDDTIFRDCCDEHDLCYEADCSSPCTKASWIFFWQRWYCTACNLQAVWCFVSAPVEAGGGVGGGEYGGWGGGSCDDGDVCTRCSYAEWCPPECVSCSVL